VKPDVRIRVRQVIDELGYEPNPAARALAFGRNDVVDLVVVDDCPPNLGVNPYYPRVMAGMLAGLAGTGAHMRVHVVSERGAADLLAGLARTSDLGAVLVNVPASMAAGARRVVTMHVSAPGVPYVDTRNAAGAYAAVTHLHAGGRRHIAAIHGPHTISCAVQRRDGYLAATRDIGQPAAGGAGEFSREVGYSETVRLLASHPDLDGLFVACDLMAAGALQALTAAGRRVPDDVAVVGYDDSVIAAATNPPLTSVRQPVEEMARAATRALLGDPLDTPVFPAELVVRESTVRLP
jgi:DNA-binding LacI/PurR family transcriptional regulator